MVILHAFLALAAGLLAATALAAAMSALLKRLTPDWVAETGKLAPGYAFVNIAWSFVAAGVGGYVTAALSGDNPMQHVLALGVILLALSALSAMQERDQQPIWYLLLLVALTPLGVLAGGLLYLHAMGIWG